MREGSGDIRTKRVVVGFDRAELEQQNFELNWWGAKLTITTSRR